MVVNRKAEQKHNLNVYYLLDHYNDSFTIYKAINTETYRILIYNLGLI